MASEFTRAIKDYKTTLSRLRERSEMLKSGGIADYTSAEYKDSAKRAVELIHPKKMKLELKKVIRETASTKTLRFERIDGALPPFRAGQYVNLFVRMPENLTSRPYSISSAPGAPHLDLTVRENKEGYVSPYLVGKAAPGDVFDSTGPAGFFCFEPLFDRGDLVFLAGGSGITPFMGMIRNFAEKGWPRKVHLIYGSRDPEDVIFGDEISAITGQFSQLKYTQVMSEPPSSYMGRTGFITAPLLEELLETVAGKTFLICGPIPMHKAMNEVLKTLNVPRHKIRRESFGAPPQVSTMPGWKKSVDPKTVFNVEVEGKGTLPAKADEPLLVSLEKAGMVVPTVCRTGQCSYCRTKLVSGKVYTLPDAAVRESDKALGFIHPCATYPQEDLKIRLP